MKTKAGSFRRKIPNQTSYLALTAVHIKVEVVPNLIGKIDFKLNPRFGVGNLSQSTVIGMGRMRIIDVFFDGRHHTLAVGMLAGDTLALVQIVGKNIPVVLFLGMLQKPTLV